MQEESAQLFGCILHALPVLSTIKDTQVTQCTVLEGKEKSWSHRVQRKSDTGEVFFKSVQLWAAADLRKPSMYPRLTLIKENDERLSNKAFSFYLPLPFWFFTRQTLLTNLTNQISETVLPFLPRASLNFEVCQPAGWVSVVLIPPPTMLRHYFFHIRGFQHHLPPSTNTSLWKSFHHLPLQVLVAHTPRSTTLWGNQNCLLGLLWYKWRKPNQAIWFVFIYFKYKITFYLQRPTQKPRWKQDAEYQEP